MGRRIKVTVAALSVALVMAGIWSIWAGRVRMVSLDGGDIVLGEGIEHAWTEVCIFPGYSSPLEARPVLKGLSCPLWERVEDRNILVVYFDDANCTSFGITGDFLEPHWVGHSCFTPEEISGDALTIEDGVVKFRWK